MEKLSSDDSNRNVHGLSHGGKILLFTCKRDPAVSVRERSGLTFRSFYFEREGNAFLNATEGATVISRKPSAHVDIVTCKCAVDVQKRVKTAFVLVTKMSEKGSSFKYSLLALRSSHRLEPCIEFKLPYQMKGKVSILQGPTVMWSHDNSVSYTSPEAEGVRKIPIQMSKCLFGELPIQKGQLFALGLSEPLLANHSPTLGYLCEGGQAFDGSLVLPHPYICITQCMRVLTADRVDDVLRCTVVAATSNQQLVLFENGTVKDTCEVPFGQAEDIQMADTGRNGCLFVVSFNQGHVCAVWKETFQMASCWSDVDSAHVDDFLGCGTEQILLIFRNNGISSGPLEKFIITDLCGISYSCGQGSEAPKASLPPQENSLLTLQALESRLQSGLIVLQELEREVRVKDRVLQQSIQVLTDVLSGRETVLSQPEQEGLVALWDSDEESNDETPDDKLHETPALSSRPKIDKLWHRITEEQLVVGLILTADSAIPASGVSLSLLTEPGQNSTPAVIQTRSQVFWLPARGPSTPTLSSPSPGFAFSEPAAKRSRQHIASDDFSAGRLAVTAVTKLAPLLTSGCVKCRAMLHYAEKAEAVFPGSGPTTAVLHCGEVSLDIRNLCQKPLLQNPQIKTDEVREDLLSLLTVLDNWVLRIDSPDYSLGDIDGWIKRREGFKKIDVSPEYLLLDSPGSSAPMLLRWHQINPFQGDLSIHSSQLQMLQFLDSMLSYLPDSCFIQPVKRARSQSTAQKLACALEKEVLSLREGLSSLLCVKDEEERKERRAGHGETPDSGSAEDLVRCCREAWQQNVEKSRLRLNPVVDAGRYREMVQSISQVKMDSDLAALCQLNQS
ncbi:PREDICTED: Fanconi anemia group B protein [Poecilia mexicana]|uniref:FA complementation group B n=1 Tax=Poecilia mexicana TaxID=48701 RepID=A0A3B3Y061_9TELE|nr:PREDICTED: Fanconi anemia group B protein [Poecilia mexicana]